MSSAPRSTRRTELEAAAKVAPNTQLSRRRIEPEPARLARLPSSTAQQCRIHPHHIMATRSRTAPPSSRAWSSPSLPDQHSPPSRGFSTTMHPDHPPKENSHAEHKPSRRTSPQPRPSCNVSHNVRPARASSCIHRPCGTCTDSIFLTPSRCTAQSPAARHSSTTAPSRSPNSRTSSSTTSPRSTSSSPTCRRSTRPTSPASRATASKSTAAMWSPCSSPSSPAPRRASRTSSRCARRT